MPKPLRGLTADEVSLLLDEAIVASAITCSRAGADPPRASELAPHLADG